jgi:hypothetical protein
MIKSLKFRVISLITIMSIIVYFLINYGPSESDNSQCINNILKNTNGHSLIIETKNRGNTPILKGKATLKDKNKIITLINKNCHSLEIQDFVETIKPLPINSPILNFEIDHFNRIISINSTVNNQLEANNIINSFNDALNDQVVPFTIKHDIKTNEQIKPSEFDLYITLLMPSISLVKMTNITIKDDRLIIKGLVRDKSREKETLEKLNTLFADEFIIINQLELVVKHAPVTEKYKFELAPMPTIDKL